MEIVNWGILSTADIGRSKVPEQNSANLDFMAADL